MTIQRTSALLATLLVLSLSGCTSSGNKPESSPAKLREALEVPPDLARPASDDLAAVPSGGAAAYSDYAAKSPAPSAAIVAPASADAKAAEPASGSVRLERDGAQRWLVVQDNSERVLGKTRDYFLRNKTTLIVDNPQAGILETDWINRPEKTTGTWSKILASLESTGLRDKFRVRIESGRAPGTTELYVSHQGMVEVVVSEGSVNVTRVVWQPSPADPEMEAEMLGNLQAHLGGTAQPQLKGQSAALDKAQVEPVKGELLLPNDDLDSAWRRVGQALDRAGVITEDRDRSAGIFFVRFVDSSQAGKRQGVFSWLLGDPDKTSAAPDAAKSEAPSDRFQVRLKTATVGTSVTVLNVKGEPEKSTVSEQLLGILQRQLR